MRIVLLGYGSAAGALMLQADASASATIRFSLAITFKGSLLWNVYCGNTLNLQTASDTDNPSAWQHARALRFRRDARPDTAPGRSRSTPRVPSPRHPRRRCDRLPLGRSTAPAP